MKSWILTYEFQNILSFGISCFCFNDSVHTSSHGLHKFLQKPDDSCYPSMVRQSSTKLLVMSQTAWLFKSQVSSCCQNFGACLDSLSCCSMNLFPQKSNQRVDRVSKDRSGASPWSGWSHFYVGVQNHVSLWDWNAVMSFSLLFFSLYTPFCYWHKSPSWIHQWI